MGQGYHVEINGISLGEVPGRTPGWAARNALQQYDEQQADSVAAYRNDWWGRPTGEIFYECHMDGGELVFVHSRRY
jgi:hypothetical protein